MFPMDLQEGRTEWLPRWLQSGEQFSETLNLFFWNVFGLGEMLAPRGNIFISFRSCGFWKFRRHACSVSFSLNAAGAQGRLRWHLCPQHSLGLYGSSSACRVSLFVESHFVRWYKQLKRQSQSGVMKIIYHERPVGSCVRACVSTLWFCLRRLRATSLANL